MRLKSSIWIAAYLRRCTAGGAYGAVSKRGHESAGAVFLEVLHRDGADLYAPTFAEEGRRFERIMQGASPIEVVDRVEKERAFDRDLWVVTVEDREGRSFLTSDEHG